MWANAQPDGRPAEYRWRPLFNAAKLTRITSRDFCWTNNIALSRRQMRQQIWLILVDGIVFIIGPTSGQSNLT